ncbi:MAG: ATP-binding protein [Microbacterium sp.]|uniref:sensor histidine kinase n=1 Tax=Microbacterium sp. TaxID=51671 RepID=UPI001D308B4C|nr:histidine kinase [Microbacterium sp.]MBW8762202.1 ATP-binding protein [Microbacterium sp.]
MSKSRSRSAVALEDDGLRLPRPPGVFRRFWARHPLFGDVLIALFCLVLSLTPVRAGEHDLPEPTAILLAVLLPISVVAACGTLLLRRRHPLIPFVAAFLAEAFFLFLGAPGGTPMVTVAAYSLAVYASSRAAWLGLGIGLGALAALSATLMAVGMITLQMAANGLIGNLVVGLIGVLIGINVGGRKRYLAALIDRSRQLLIERDQQAQLAAAAERARIAREMHDIVSHSLTVIVALSEGAAATSDAARAREAATAAAATARSALGEMRSMLGVLRDDGAPLPLSPMSAPTPHDTVMNAQRAGFPVSLSSTGGTTFGPGVEHAVARIVQEGVTNAIRHAPAATTIAVRLERSARGVVVEIVNDGAGDASGPSGFGLKGLTERVAHVNGDIEYGRTEGSRWRLRATVPGGDPGAEKEQEQS